MANAVSILSISSITSVFQYPNSTNISQLSMGKRVHAIVNAARVGPKGAPHATWLQARRPYRNDAIHRVAASGGKHPQGVANHLILRRAQRHAKFQFRESVAPQRTPARRKDPSPPAASP